MMRLQVSFATTAYLLFAALSPQQAAGFAPLALTSSKRSPRPSTLQQRRQHTHLNVKAAHGHVHTAMVGSIWPFLTKFKIGPTKAKEIVASVAEVTNWKDVLLLLILCFTKPIVKWIHKTFDGDDDRSISEMRRFGFVEVLDQISKVASSAYAVEVLSIALTTIGFKFPKNWRLAEIYAKAAYAGWAVQRLLVYKKIALTKVFNVSEEEMGRASIVDRLLNGVIISISLLLFGDWLSVKMNKALGGIFALGSAGTLAFTLASQGLVTQLLSGIFLMASGRFFVGDAVSFGDGTSGKVIKMGWMETRLRGGDNIVTRVPNTLLSSQKVKNLSRVKQCQVKQTIRFHYEDAEKLPLILEDIRTEIKEACPRLIKDNSRPFRVFWTAYNDDHLEVMVDTHHNIAPFGDAYWHNRQNILIAITKAIQKHNVRLAHGIPEVFLVPRDYPPKSHQLEGQNEPDRNKILASS